MPHTFAVSAAVELAVVERDGFVESRHCGSAIVLAPDGTARERLGDPDALVLPRSTLKPLQALACLAAGAPLEAERLALSTASHTGTDRHVSVVRDILDAAGLDETWLECPQSWPTDSAARAAMIRAGGEPARIRMACSGKHAAMLLACVAAGWEPLGYLVPQHPLQSHIRDVVERFTGEKVAATVVDGCGAPVHAVSLAGLAKAMHRMGTASATSPFALHRNSAALIAAGRENAWAIEGPDRPDTVLIERLGVFAKSGAEGLQLAVAPDGTTVAIKLLDGTARAGAAIALDLLHRHGALSADDVADTLHHLPIAVTGGDRTVGSVRATTAEAARAEESSPLT